eukprot:880771-Amphidinium_carterae.1
MDIWDIDSAPTFKARLQQLALPDAVAKAIIDSGLSTFSNFAWIVGVAPGTLEADGVFVNRLNELLPQEPSAGVQASLRRLWAESHAMWVADTRSKVTPSSDVATKRVPLPERADRLREQRERLKGLNTDGVLAPSFALQDLVANMKQEN